MVDLRTKLLPLLENHRLPNMDAGSGSIYPHYGGFSISNLPSSICRWLDIPGLGIQPLAEDILGQLNQNYQHVILILVDGLGLSQFEEVLDDENKEADSQIWSSLLPNALLAPLTSMVPSTTASALTTLWTGVPVASHGITGYEMWLKEYSMIINSISHSAIAYTGDPGGLRRSGFQPETFLTNATLGSHLAQNGILPFAYHHQAIFRSSLSNMLLTGAKSIPYRTLSDLWVTLDSVLEANAREKTYSYVYWGDLDELSHRYGPQDRRIKLEFANFSRLFAQFLGMLRSRSRANTLVLVTADHGLVPTPRNSNFELRFHSELYRCLTMLPSGENRLPYLYLHPGAEENMIEYVDQTWDSQFRLMPSRQVLASGLFGSDNIHPRLVDRIGDWIAFPQDYAYWWWTEKENLMLGRHGGLSRAEMLVPLLALPL